MVRSVTALLLVLAVANTPVAARTVVLQPVRDNTLYESLNGQLSNGAGPDMFSGRTQRFGVRRALVAFDLTDSIPANSFIDSVQVVLHLNRTATPAASTGLHRVSRAWGEGTSVGSGGGGLATTGDATWLHTNFATNFWDTAGGDFVAPASATQVVGDLGFHTWQSTPELVADVQFWLQHPAANFGWLILVDESAPSAKRFDSRESLEPANRPQLVVHFSAVAVEPTAWSVVKTLYR